MEGQMNPRAWMGFTAAVAAVLGVWALPITASAESMAFKVLGGPSRAIFRTDAPLETVLGTAGGAAVQGTLTVDLARPNEAKGQVRVDLNAMKTGIDKRDADMRAKTYLDSETNEDNRWAVFDLKSVEIVGPLEPGRERPARVQGTLTIRGKPVEIVADARVTHVKFTAAQFEEQKRLGFTADNLRVLATFATKFTNHGMQIPQFLIFKLSDDIKLETQLTFVQQ
jgi:polyisoprenoid-binding protein YceI